MCKEEGRTPYYTPSTHRYGPRHEDNRDRKKYEMGYDTSRVVDRGVRPGVRETLELWGSNEGKVK